MVQTYCRGDIFIHMRRSPATVCLPCSSNPTGSSTPLAYHTLAILTQSTSHGRCDIYTTLRHTTYTVLKLNIYRPFRGLPHHMLSNLHHTLHHALHWVPVSCFSLYYVHYDITSLCSHPMRTYLCSCIYSPVVADAKIVPGIFSAARSLYYSQSQR